MRTTPFAEVYHGVLRRMGMDPDGDAIRYDTARPIAQAVNKRIRTAWSYWPWPEFLVTEERAFRTIWSSGKSFFIAGANGQPDEFIWLDDMLYYRVKTSAPIDPPAGTLPTDTTYFETFSPVDAFVAYDQVCRRPMGVVFGVYSGNPRLNGNGSGNVYGLYYRPSEKGIDVAGSHGSSVFIKYQHPPPRFSLTPYAHGRAYHAGNVVFEAITGECYIALVDNASVPPTDTNFWRRVLFPTLLEQYVIAGAYADMLKTGKSIEQTTAILAADAIAEAEEYLRHEIDLLTIQGDRYFYPAFRTWYYPGFSWGYLASEAWTGGIVTTLTEICETDPAYPIPPRPMPPISQYHPEIDFILTADGTPSLEAYPTVGLLLNTKFELVIMVGGSKQLQEWQLVSGPANPLDPGEVTPSDYDLALNDKHWVKIG